MDSATATNALMLLPGSFATILENWPFFAVLLIGQLTFSILVGWLLSGTVEDKSALASLSFSGGMLGLTVFFLVLSWFKIKPAPILFLPVAILFIAMLGWQWRQAKGRVILEWVWLALFFIFTLSLRLIFIQGLLVPQYADSVQHLKIVQDILSPQQPAQAFYQLSLNLNRYYHFGFHATAAWLSGLSSTDANLAILLLGQYFQALAIFVLYPLARVIFNNSLSAWMLTAIGGLFLPIPAYASNWGKYPAIASMVGLGFVLSLLFTYFQSGTPKRVFPARYYWLVLLSIFASLFLHSRSILTFLLLIVIFTGAFFYHQKTQKAWDTTTAEIQLNIKATFAIVASFLFTLVFMAMDLPFHPLFAVFLIGILWLAFFADFRLTFYFCAYVLLAYPLSLVEIDLFEHSLSIIDRPYTAIFLYIPLAVFITLPLNKLVCSTIPSVWKKIIFSLVFISGISFILFFQNHQPSPCCKFFDDDDLFAFAWIRHNLPENEVLGIAATGQPGNLLYADGGAWIEMMTGVSTRKLDSATDFAIESDSICQRGIQYVYVDGLENSFDAYTLVEAKAKHLLGFGTVSIFQLPCD